MLQMWHVLCLVPTSLVDGRVNTVFDRAFESVLLSSVVRLEWLAAVILHSNHTTGRKVRTGSM